MHLKLVKASPEYERPITDMLDEWYAYGELLWRPLEAVAL